MISKWQTNKINELCIIKSGLWAGKKPPFLKINIIRNTNFGKDGKLDDSDIANLDVEQKQFNTRKLEYGDIILEKSGGGPKQPVGRVIVFDRREGNYSFSNFTSLIRIKDPQNLDFNYLHKFLYYEYLNGTTEKIQSNSTGIRNLNLNSYKEIKVPVLAITEQKRIVKTLDETFERISKVKENTEKNLQNVKDLFESYLSTSKGTKVPLGQLVNITTGKLNANEMVDNGKYPFFTCAKEVYSINKYAFDCEAILLAGNNAVGDFNVKHYVGKFNAYQRTYVITVNNHNKVLYRYLYFQLLKSLKEFKHKSVGAGTKFLKLDMIKNLQIDLPSPSDQQAIVNGLDALSEQTSKLENNYKQKLVYLDELKQSILHQAFTGQL